MYNYNKANFAVIRARLKKTVGSPTLDVDVDSKWTRFKKALQTVKGECVPLKTTSNKRRNAMWIDRVTMSSVKRKYRVYSKYKNDRHPAYVKAMELARASVKEEKRKFEHKLAENVKNDCKSFYAYVRTAQ